MRNRRCSRVGELRQATPRPRDDTAILNAELDFARDSPAHRVEDHENAADRDPSVVAAFISRTEGVDGLSVLVLDHEARRHLPVVALLLYEHDRVAVAQRVALGDAARDSGNRAERERALVEEGEM